MGKRSQYHVTKGSSGWKVVKAGSQRATSVHSIKKEAVDAGRETAKKAPLGQLVIHTGDGRIQTEYTYGNDPCPPRG